MNQRRIETLERLPPMNRQRIARLERNLPAPADKPCRCLLAFSQDEPAPPDGVLCDRCGLMRRGEHILVEEIILEGHTR